jgi:hypothetical protein
VGTPVLGGMLAAALVGVFAIPMLYLVFQWLRERAARRTAEMQPIPGHRLTAKARPRAAFKTTPLGRIAARS